MKFTELEIKFVDWIYILFLGTLISLSLSAFIYIVANLNWVHGIFFGATLGINIAILSMIFITFSNRIILPKVPKSLWRFIAMIFSFSAGFFAFLLTNNILSLANIEKIEIVENKIYLFSSIIGAITYLIGALMYRFVEMRNEKLKIESLLVESRLKSLNTQLNPHFLFNSLNSVLGLMYLNFDQAEKMIIEISKFLRSTMEERDIVSIEEELKMVERYIYIENIRFGEIIKLENSIEKRTLEIKVPKFSIQLLVENALKHSNIKQFKNFKIEIEIKSLKDRTFITVSNSGKPPKSIKFGTGLSNLEERLNYLFNGKVYFLKDVNSKISFKIEIGNRNENINS
jgi:LytS/YehU family sensor histidine kinase